MLAFRTGIIKITCANLRNSCIRLSSDVTAAKPPSAKPDTEDVTLSPSSQPPPPVKEAAATVNQAAVLESATTAALNVAARYNVVGERTFGGFSKPLSIAELNHRIQNDLQPCKMPEFYTGRENKEQVVQFPKNIFTKEAAFAESKTRANLTLPLKPVKLASPFPEPVKVMMSDTTSDKVKAQQMLAESKSQKMSASDWDRPQTPFSRRNYSTLYNSIVVESNSRYYTTTTQPLYSKKSKKKCKLVEGKRICPSMKLKNCPAKARESCDGVKDWRCKKLDSPHPAYSELCHEDVIDKPTECKMCPWRSEKHPTFKAPKRKLHTLKTLFNRRNGLEILDDRIKVVKAEVASLNEAARTMRDLDDIDPIGDAKTLDDDGMLCDLRKPPCKRPPPNPCGQKKKKKPKPKPAPKKYKKCDSDAASEQPAEANVSELMAAENATDPVLPDRGLIDGLGAEDVMEAARRRKKLPVRKRGKCQKLPFRPFDTPKRNPIDYDRPCPKKQKPRIDCPPEKVCSRVSATNAEVDSAAVPMSSTSNPYKMEYLMGKKQKRDEKKCPKIHLPEKEEEEREPCRKKKQPLGPCPNNLLPIKRRVPRFPKKKLQDNSVTSIPVDMTSEPTQQEHPKV